MKKTERDWCLKVLRDLAESNQPESYKVAIKDVITMLAHDGIIQRTHKKRKWKK